MARGAFQYQTCWAGSGIRQTSIRDGWGQGERRGAASFRDERSQISAAAGCTTSEGVERSKVGLISNEQLRVEFFAEEGFTEETWANTRLPS